MLQDIAHHLTYTLFLGAGLTYPKHSNTNTYNFHPKRENYTNKVPNILNEVLLIATKLAKLAQPIKPGVPMPLRKLLCEISSCATVRPSLGKKGFPVCRVAREVGIFFFLFS